MKNLLYGKKIKNMTKGFTTRYNSVGKFKSIAKGVYGRNDKDNERLSKLLNSYESVIDTKSRQRSPFDIYRFNNKD